MRTITVLLLLLPGCVEFQGADYTGRTLEDMEREFGKARIAEFFGIPVGSIYRWPVYETREGRRIGGYGDESPVGLLKACVEDGRIVGWRLVIRDRCVDGGGYDWTADDD